MQSKNDANQNQNQNQLQNQIQALDALLFQTEHAAQSNPSSLPFMSSNQSIEHDAILLDQMRQRSIFTNKSSMHFWEVKNTGYKSFGNDCKLMHVSGDGLLVTKYDIPNAKPNESVKILLHFHAFSSHGMYQTNFRLCIDGKQFGPMLTIKINVVDPLFSQGDPAGDSVQKSDGYKGSIEKLKESQKGIKTNLACSCGRSLHKMDVKDGYDGQRVICNICSTVIEGDMYHCPAGIIPSHPKGFDMCFGCGGSQSAKQLSTSNLDGNNGNYDPNFIYPSQLKTLLDMGFDEDKSRALLLSHQGNVSQVLMSLIK